MRIDNERLVAHSQRTDASHQSVLRWEREVGAGINLAARDWHSTNEAMLWDPTITKSQRCVLAVGSDAANRKLLHEEQLLVCVCACCYALYDKEEGCNTLHLDDQEFWGDCYKVVGHTAGHCHASVLKSLKSIGVPTWVDQQDKFSKIANLKADGSLDSWKGSAPQHWTVYCATTDAGSDEAKMREYGNWITHVIPFVLWWDNACWHHQVHMRVLKQLLVL